MVDEPLAADDCEVLPEKVSVVQADGADEVSRNPHAPGSGDLASTMPPSRSAPAASYVRAECSPDLNLRHRRLQLRVHAMWVLPADSSRPVDNSRVVVALIMCSQHCLVFAAPVRTICEER